MQAKQLEQMEQTVDELREALSTERARRTRQVRVSHPAPLIG